MASDSVYQELADCPETIFDAFPINHGEYMTVSRWTTVNKYSASTNQWHYVHDMDVTHPHKVVCYDRSSNSLLFINNQTQTLKSMDLDQGTISTHCSDTNFHTDSMILNDDELHIFGYRYHALGIGQFHKVIKYRSWKLITESSWADECYVPKAFISDSRNSVIAAEFSTDDDQTTDNFVLKEYSLQSTQWECLEWSRYTIPSEDTAFVCTLDGRYVIGFGDEQSNIIAIFDFKEQTVRESAIKCPVQPRSRSLWGNYDAVLMGNKKQDELAVFGFVNQAFKEPAFDAAKRERDGQETTAQTESQWIGDRE